MDIKLNKELDIGGATEIADTVISKFKLPLVKVPRSDVYIYAGGEIRFSYFYETNTVPNIFISLGTLFNDETSVPVIALGRRLSDGKEEFSKITPLTGISLLVLLFETSIIEFPIFIPRLVHIGAHSIIDAPTHVEIKGARPPQYTQSVIGDNCHLAIEIIRLDDRGRQPGSGIFQRYEKIQATFIVAGELFITPRQWNKIKKAVFAKVRNLGRPPRPIPLDKTLNFAEQVIHEYKLGLKEAHKSDFSIVPSLWCEFNIAKAYKSKEIVVAFGCVQYGHKQYPCVFVSDEKGIVHESNILIATKVNILGALLYTKLCDMRERSYWEFSAYSNQFEIAVTLPSWERITLFVRDGKRLINPQEWSSFFRHIALRRAYLML